MEAPVFLDSKKIDHFLLNIKVEELTKYLSDSLHLSPTDFYLTQNGKKLDQNVVIVSSENVHMHFRMLGGKGGFGSMLRAIGAQIEKTTNREACRDLSGRRLRDINEEKRLKTWLEKQKERDEEAAAKTSKKIEKLQAKPKHEFKDDEYFETRMNLEETVSEAIEEGLQKASTSTAADKSTPSCSSNDSSRDKTEIANAEKKRKRNAKKKKGKKKAKGALWIDANLSSSSSDSSEDSNGEGSRDDDKSLEVNDKSKITEKSIAATSSTAVAVDNS